MNTFKPFQIRWKEPLSANGLPYCYRWSFVFFGYSIRIHHWLGGDHQEPSNHLHNHPHDFISILLKGGYTNLYLNEQGEEVAKRVSFPSIWGAKATAYHHLIIPSGGAWTLVLCGRPYVKWGFLVNGHNWRPLRYFHSKHAQT